MNVLFSANDKAFEGLELAIYTLLSHNKNVNIYIFTMNCQIINEEEHSAIDYFSLQPWQIDKLQRIVKYLGGGNSHLIIKDVYNLYMQYLDKSVNRYTQFTPFTALRLLADIALPYVNDLWYFDCDVTINGDISSYYYNYIQKGCSYAAYVTPEACHGKGEMVAGVMFMNLAKMREEKFLVKARYNYNNLFYEYPDQCAIRDVGSPEIFPPTLGYCENLEDCLELPLIIHFTNKISPKIYCAKSREHFFRKFPFLKYAQTGIALVDDINFR